MKFSKPLLAAVALIAVSAYGQTDKSDKGEAYYRYSLGHLYSELAGAYGSRGDYFDKAVENYWAAMKADPSAGFIAEELSDFYVQSGRLRDGVTQAEDALKANPDSLNARRVLARIYMRLIGDSQHNQIDEGMVKKAIEQFEKITAKNPQDLDSWLMLGRLYKVSQSSNDAMAAYKKALGIDPENQDALTGLALVYSDLGDNKSAADLLGKVAAKDPSPRTLAALASAYEQMKDYQLAATTLRRIVDQNPDANPELLRALAQDLMLSQQYDDALKIYKKLTDDDARDAQSWLSMSRIYRQQRNFPKAHEAADKAREIDPTNLDIRYNEANLLEAEGKLPEAITTLREILENTAKKEYSAQDRANRGILLDRLGFLYRSNEQYDKAVDTFREFAAMDTDSAARAEAQIIDTYRVSRSFDKALEESESAVKKFPGDRFITDARAMALADAGRMDEAIAMTRKLLNGKNDVEVYISLAQLNEKGKHYAEATNALDSASKLAVSKEDKVNILFLRGDLLEKEKKYDEAEAAFKKVLELDPDNTSAMNYIGYMLAERNTRLDEAEQFIQKALQRDPNNGAFLDSLGWVYFRMNKLNDAESNLRRALQHMSTDPTVHDHLGDVLFHQGKIKDAITHWQNSLKQYAASSKGDQDPEEEGKIQKKLEGARVRLARESSGARDEKQP
ncbi:MAG TPA: tetratricopeptide repeat protein [Bryobacteraceae bacterium]|nr:tetratricopeptide repeat protein [Bryobacteraceae bacterium]